MKEHVFRIPLLIAALSIAAPILLQAAPSLSITEPPVTSTFMDGPMTDPWSTNGQWFLSLDGTKEYRTHEFHDNLYEFGGADPHVIDGRVATVQFGGGGVPWVDPIVAFTVKATIENNTPWCYGQESDSSNSHDEFRLTGTKRYIGALLDTKLTVEFAIADSTLLPQAFTGPYQNPWPPSYIIAENEEQLAWYCWNEQDPPQGDEPGNYYVPTWDFGDIAVNDRVTKVLNFSVSPPMDPTDPRYASIFDAHVEEVDIFANRTTSLKISTWIDDVGVDFGDAYPDDVLRSSDVSVFHNAEEPIEPPHKMHWPQLPYPFGWDVRACLGGDDLYKVLADDFRCTSNGPITHITFWGSFQWDEYMYEETFHGISKFHLSLHDDIPDSGLEGDYSKPVVPALWEVDFDPYNPPAGWTITVEQEISSPQGWYDPNTEEWEHPNHENYFRYDVWIPETEAFVQTAGTIYWLDISVETEGPMWGWKTSGSEHFNDDAVWADLPVQDPAQWNELIDPITQESLDLAFIIDGGEPIPQEEYDFGDLPDVYNTLLANLGAHHTIVQGIHLGAGVDPEPDGQPTNGADGDDMLDGNDDEDGITFLSPLIAGQTASIQVTASIGGTLEAWLDADNSGNWSAGDNILTMTIPAGPTAGNLLPIPATVAPGPNVLRFRFNTLAALGSPTGGPAINGEVEDYAVTIAELDWGDAPDAVVPTGYPTLKVNNGARHIIAGGTANPLRLGAMVDSEADGQPLNGADGDDVLDGNDDEDGIAFNTPLIPGAWAQITVTANGPAGTTAYLQGWIDFYANADWLDTGEQIFTDLPLAIPGTYTLNFPVPPSASNSMAFARFRLSYAAGVGITGQAFDGEVEDHKAMILEPKDIDWGDAYDNFMGMVYPSLSMHNGAHHVIMPRMFLGHLVDPEPDGQPALSCMGDDINALDDEDGVFFTTPLQPGGFAGVDVIASQPGVLDAWIDFNNDGDWADSGEQIFTLQTLGAGTNALLFGVPVTAPQGTPLVSRFRYSSVGVASFTGFAMDGEVEDHLTPRVETIEAQGLDWGDADLPYPTILGNNGARHTIVPGVVLGALIDNEPDGQPHPQAMGDDIDLIFPGLGDDEDGVIFMTQLVASSNGVIDVITGVTGGFLDAWIDFNNDGMWANPGEHLFGGSLLLAPGLNTGITFPVPGLPAQALGPTAARFRLSSGGGLSPFGPAVDGEVEDYMVDLFQPAPTNLVITNLTFNALGTVATNEWTVETGIIYQLESKTNLLVNPWIPSGSTVLGPANLQTDAMLSAESNKFYRVTAPWTP